MNEYKTPLEMIGYPIGISFGFSLVFIATQIAQMLEIIGTISLILIGVAWFIWLIIAYLEIWDRLKSR